MEILQHTLRVVLICVTTIHFLPLLTRWPTLEKGVQKSVQISLVRTIKYTI